MVVSQRPTTRDEKQRLVSRLLVISLKPRPVELTVVVETDIRPWRYPPKMDFQYGDWWRKEFEAGDLQPWPSAVNPDLALLIRMVLLADAPLHGTRPADVFDPVPSDDYLAALIHGKDGLLDDLEWDTVNVVLTLARVWRGIITEDVVSKDVAADWALERLPEEHRRVLQHARAVYLGDEMDVPERFATPARSYADHVVAEIRERLRVRP
jgi:streptomycin 3"-adenylyltransferase